LNKKIKRERYSNKNYLNIPKSINSQKEEYKLIPLNSNSTKNDLNYKENKDNRSLIYNYSQENLKNGFSFKEIFKNNSIHNNNSVSISKKELSFVNKYNTQNNKIIHLDDNSIENIYIEEEQESSIIEINKKNENEQIKLNFDIEKKNIEYKKGDKVQFNFNQNFIFCFEIEILVKNKFCKISTGFSIIYLEDQDNESYEINKLIHCFCIENNTKINYLINLKEGFYNYDIQENSKELKKKKLHFHKINLSKIFHINPYIKLDKENECEYFFNNQKIKYEIKK
jgi:hypothetical protein